VTCKLVGWAWVAVGFEGGVWGLERGKGGKEDEGLDWIIKNEFLIDFILGCFFAPI